MNIPTQMLETLVAYRDSGRPTGSFVEAVLSNDLFDAVSRADLSSQAALVDIVKWVYNNMPMNAHGSREKYRAWLAMWTEKREMASRE